MFFFLKSIGVKLHIHGLVHIGAYSSHYIELNEEQIFVQTILPKIINNEEKKYFLIWKPMKENIQNFFTISLTI